MAASVKVLRAEGSHISIADTFSNLKATHDVKTDATTQPNVQAASILPVDSGIVVDTHMVQRFVKGEDLAFQYRADPDLLGRSMMPSQPGDPNEWKLNYDVFVVCDGHSGIRANEFVHREFLATLHPLMPLALPASFRSNVGATYAGAVRAAVARTLESLNARFCEAMEPAGCTCTVVLVTGPLLTVANIGDSDAVLDAFSEWLPMSVPHRVNDNVAERERIEAMGSEIAPLSVAMDGPARGGEPGLGPLRIWPGGLCVSRGIGDVDVGECVIARPHVRQVVVPEWGCRLIVCSDGVWDCISTRTVVSTCKVCRSPRQLAPR